MTTQPYEPPSIAPITLESQTRRCHEARRRVAVARGMLPTGAARFEAGGLAIAELHDDAELAVLQEEDTLRALAVAAFHATGQSAVSPGITVTEGVVRNDHFPYAIRPIVTLADDLGAALDAAEADARLAWDTDIET